MAYGEAQVELGVMKVVLEMMGDVVGLDYGGAMEMVVIRSYFGGRADRLDDEQGVRER